MKSVLHTIFVFCFLAYIGCTGETLLPNPQNGKDAAHPDLVGAPIISIPSVADENRVALTFSSNLKLEVSDDRNDKQALGPSMLRLASEPLFSLHYAIEKTLRSLGYKIVDDGPLSIVGHVRRYELLQDKNPELSQAYVRITFSVTDPLGAPLLERDYEGSSGSSGSPEQKLGAALSDILSQIAIDKELQTVLASY